MKTVCIATRKSPLALWQAQYVADLLKKQYPAMRIELLPLLTEGDRRLGTLSTNGGKGLFLKELEQALVDGRADIAVHSMKDIPALLPDNMTIVSVLARHDPCDAFVSNRYSAIDQLPHAATVGTSSSRRKAQLLNYRPDLRICELRGNVATRLAKLDDGEYQAIVLASAGLKRLGRDARIRQRLPFSTFLPAIGQGIIALECLRDNHVCRSHMSATLHMPTWFCQLAERACGQALQADCHSSLAVYARVNTNKMIVEAEVLDASGHEKIRHSVYGNIGNAQQLGRQLADSLLMAGALQLLAHETGTDSAN